MRKATIRARQIGTALCELATLEPGHSRGFDPLGEGRQTMFVIRHADGIVGWRNACPHYDHARMAWKADEFMNGDHTLILCGAHGALFDIHSGRCISGPCIGQYLTQVPLLIKDGAVYIVGEYQPGLRKNLIEDRAPASDAAIHPQHH